MAYPPTELPNDTGNISANKSFELKDFNDRFGNIKAYIESLKEEIDSINDNKVDKIEGSSLVEDDYIDALKAFLPFSEVSYGNGTISFSIQNYREQYLFYIKNNTQIYRTTTFYNYSGGNSITAGSCLFDDSNPWEENLSRPMSFDGYWVRIDHTHFYRAETFFNKFKTSIDNKVDKVNGKGLSTNDFTNYYQSRIDLTQGLAFFPVSRIWDQASPFYPFVYSGYDGSSENAGKIPSLLIYDKNKILEKRHYIVEMNPNGYIPQNSSDSSDIPFFVPNYRVLSGLPQLYVKSDITVNYTPPDFSEPFTLSLYVPTNDCSSGAMKHASIQIAKGSYNFYYPAGTSGTLHLNHTFCIPFSTYGTEIKNIKCKAYNINTDTGNNGNETYEYIKLLNCRIYPSLHNYSVSRLNGIPVQCSGNVDYMGRERCAWLEFDYYDPNYTVSSSNNHFGYNDNYIS